MSVLDPWLRIGYSRRFIVPCARSVRRTDYAGSQAPAATNCDFEHDKGEKMVGKRKWTGTEAVFGIGFPMCGCFLSVLSRLSPERTNYWPVAVVFGR